MMKLKTRVEFDNTRVDKPTTRYYYDGQMGIEEDSAYISNEQNANSLTRLGTASTGGPVEAFKTDDAILLRRSDGN